MTPYCSETIKKHRKGPSSSSRSFESMKEIESEKFRPDRVESSLWSNCIVRNDINEMKSWQLWLNKLQFNFQLKILFSLMKGFDSFPQAKVSKVKTLFKL